MQEQVIKQTKGKFLPKKTKRKTGWIIGGLAAAALALVGISLTNQEETPLLDLADTTVIAYTDLQRTISATGTVESARRTTVYSMVSYPVMAVHVEVGDRVAEGDLLAELDDQSIRNQIATQEINLDLSSQSSAQQVESLSPLELFDQLYAKQNDRPMSDQQREFAQNLIESIWEGKL